MSCQVKFRGGRVEYLIGTVHTDSKIIKIVTSWNAEFAA